MTKETECRADATEVADLSQSVSEKDSANEISSHDLWREDLNTFDGDWTEPGFLAIRTNRFGKRMQEAPKGIRKILGMRTYRLFAILIDWIFGIKIPLYTRLGRRVRIWHHGCILLNAKSIGDDVHIRQDTTLGPRMIPRSEALPDDMPDIDSLPVIESGVDIGSGACIMGPVTVGEGAMVGANSVVLKDVPKNATVLGVPARKLPT